MSNGNPRRKRSNRVASVVLPPGAIARAFHRLREPPFLLRVGLCVLAALLMWVATGGWKPPFAFRAGYVPNRDVVANTQFTRPDPEKTEELRRQRRSETICIYQHDVGPLVELQKALKDHVFQLLRTESVEQVPRKIWNRFLPQSQRSESPPKRLDPEMQDRFESFKSALVDDPDLASLEKAVQQALAPYEETGLLESLEHGLEEGSQSTILVHPVGNESFQQRVNVREVRIGEATADLQQDLKESFQEAFPAQEDAVLLAQFVHSWLQSQKIPATLSLNEEATDAARERAVASVEPVEYTYRVGEKIAAGGQPLSTNDVKLLQREYEAQVEAMPLLAKVQRGLADSGMFIALYVLCGFYIFFHERRLLTDLRQFATMLGLVVLTVVLCVLTSTDAWRVEIIPLGLFGMTVAIAYERELALLLSAVVTLLVSLSLGFGLAEFVILVASVVALILCLTRIRSRTKLIYVGMIAGLMTMATALGVGILVGQTFASPAPVTIPVVHTNILTDTSFILNLLRGSAWFGFCSVLTGLVMTGLLPFIEKLLDIQTDISLLELGDAAHPLLQELARRAPGTYNHSINVASLAEAATEAIHGNGLLVRVGAYFHDIGKMLKPAYFVENQGQDPNRHKSLVPAMSTLVIIAHVKDGADLARQHHLPQSIIDFIEQHHGTTLVEYFYRQATLHREEHPDSGEIEEANFRYPGPKPQTLEAAVLMLADAVESASRALVDPAPARLDNLVHEIAMKRLLDGQFDECGLTLKDLAIVEDTLAKSLTAVYHGRVKYPNQQTA